MSLWDTEHAIISTVILKKNARLHRFKNKAGVEYSAIYYNGNEELSCEREKEKDMIEYWNTEYSIYYH